MDIASKNPRRTSRGPVLPRAGPAWPPSNPDDVTAVVAHELKTPLTTIRSVAEILQDNPDLPEAERKRFLALLAEETARLDATIDRLLRASTAGRDRWVVDTAPFVRPPFPT